MLGSLALVPSAYGWTDSGRQLSLEWPAQGRLNSAFGHDGSRPHSGLDIGVLSSLDVDAAEEGVVTRVGQRVSAGERLGLAGCTGWCTGTHLHFELRDHEVPIDPMPLITGYNPAF